MPGIIQVELRGSGLGNVPIFVNPDTVAAVIAESQRQAVQQAGGGDLAPSGGSFVDEYGTPLLAGAGAFVLGLVIAKFARRKRKRR